MARQIQAAQMAMHHQLSRQPQAASLGCRQHGQGRLNAELALTADRSLDNPLGHRTHLDNQAAGPALHQKARLGSIGLVQVNRQPQLALQTRRQS